MNKLPKFSEIEIDKIESTLDSILAINRQELKSLLNEQAEYTWNNIIRALEEMDNKLSRCWSPISHLNSVMNSFDLREVHDRCILKISEYSTEMSQDEDLI